MQKALQTHTAGEHACEVSGAQIDACVDLLRTNTLGILTCSCMYPVRIRS